METTWNSDDRSASERTARIALLAATPGLVLTALAALSANSLALRADLVLTILDTLVLTAVWAVALAARDGRRGRSVLRRAEHLACMLAAACMLVSMGVVVWTAIGRIAGGGLAPSGAGVAIGIAVNGGYAAVNLWVLRRWHRRHRRQPSAFTRSQVCLFRDKLSTNLIVSVSLAAGVVLGEAPLGAYVDPLAALLIALATAWWVTPVLRDALRATGLGWRRRHRRSARAVDAAARFQVGS